MKSIKLKQITSQSHFTSAEYFYYYLGWAGLLAILYEEYILFSSIWTFGTLIIAMGLLNVKIVWENLRDHYQYVWLILTMGFLLTLLTYFIKSIDFISFCIVLSFGFIWFGSNMIREFDQQAFSLSFKFTRLILCVAWMSFTVIVYFSNLTLALSACLFVGLFLLFLEQDKGIRVGFALILNIGLLLLLTPLTIPSGSVTFSAIFSFSTSDTWVLFILFGELVLLLAYIFNLGQQITVGSTRSLFLGYCINKIILVGLAW